MLRRKCVSRAGRMRRFPVAVCLASFAAALAAAPQGQSPKPAAGQPPAAGQGQAAQPQQEQQPTFRSEANFVRVDVYPTASGRPVQDLTQADFQVFEDGQRQEIRTFEHVVIQGGGPQETRAEPRTVAESREMAADPRARLFVLFIDTYHVSRDAAFTVRRSLSRVLDRAIGPNDLVAVMTPEMAAASITFVRRTASIDELLDKWMKWGRRNEAVFDPDPVEERYQQCYPPSPGEGNMSAIAREMVDRRREQLTLDAMRDLIVHLQGLREERKAILTISEGWLLYGRNSNLARPVNGQVPGPPAVGVGPTGGLRVGDLGRNPGGSMYECDQDRMRLSQEEHDRQFRDLLDEANRANASFYTIDPRGLPAFDTPISAGPIVSPAADQAMLGSRLESLRTLAGATDGVAVLNSNDIDKGLQRVVDDLTSYYLLGYYSANAKADGKFHSIGVKVTRPGVAVRARRGYRSPTREEMDAVVRGAAATGKDEASPATKAVGGLSRIRTDAAVHAVAGYDWRPSGAGSPEPGLWIALELDPAIVSRDEPWRAGADVAITVTAADKSKVAEVQQVLKRDARNAIVRIAPPPAVPADYAIRVTSKPAGAALGSTETLRVVVPRPPAEGLTLGQAIVYRRGPFTGTAWQPAGDLRFRRQERVRVDLPVLGSFTDAQVQLLDRNGKPLPIPVISSTRDENGQKIVSGEVTLAPLTTGDYVLETALRQGATTQKILTAFRIIP